MRADDVDVRSPRVTVAVPATTTQCSLRRWCSCSEMRRAGLHFDALDLEAGAFLQHRVGAPWSRDRPVKAVGVVAARLELRSDLAHALQMVAMRDENGIRRVDDDQILDADRRDDAILGMDERAARGDGHTLAAAAVALRVGGVSSDTACHEPTSLQSNAPRTTATLPAMAAGSITA